MGVTVLLVCAVLASLSAGVLLAYAICLAMFSAFRIHAVRSASASARELIAAQVLES